MHKRYELGLFLFVSILFAAMLFTLAYWQVFSSTLNDHLLNPRYQQLFCNPRGSVLDRHGNILAQSLLIDGKYHRQYTEVSSLIHVIGYFHDKYGLTGIEKTYNDVLAREQNLTTTIDLVIQSKIEKIFTDYVGAIVLLEPATGAIIAMVSSPFIDYARMELDWENYLLDPNAPFVNRALQGLYPPGSVLKPLILGAAYEEEIINADSKWDDQGELSIDGRVIKNFGGNALGLIDPANALAFSSNVVFAEIALKLQHSLLEYLKKAGLGQATQIGLGESVGNLPNKVKGFEWGQIGIGQGELLVTPMQMAVISATIANNGVRMQPYLVYDSLAIRKTERVFSRTVAAKITEAMILAVNNGTASLAQVSGVAVAGKLEQLKALLVRILVCGFAPERTTNSDSCYGKTPRIWRANGGAIAGESSKYI